MAKFNRREFMQASTASLALNRVKVSASTGSAIQAGESATAFVRTNAEGESWTLGNALVEREIRFDPSGPAHPELAPQGNRNRFHGVRRETERPTAASSRFRWMESCFRDRTGPAGNSSKLKLRSSRHPGKSLASTCGRKRSRSKSRSFTPFMMRIPLSKNGLPSPTVAQLP